MNRIAALLALACAMLPAQAQRVRVDFDHAVHFSHYKTYSWAPAPEGQWPETLFPNELMRKRIAGFIEEAFAAKGIKRVASGGDLVVGYQVAVSEEPIYTTFNNGWGWDGGISTTTVQTIYHGTVVVEVRDAHRDKLIFQGVATQTISSRPARNTKRLAKAVSEIFEKYPPQL
jgi:hypothetical protein